MQIYFFVVVKYIMTYAAVFIVAIQFTQLYDKIEETKENQIKIMTSFLEDFEIFK